MSRTDPQNETRAAIAGETGFAPPEVIVVTQKRVMCDGGGGALGHPRVYYDMGEETFVECGYCDRRFVLKGSKDDPDA
ncbi:MAG: zinc-finger domain-containing protein [Oceanicaulis sp.]